MISNAKYRFGAWCALFDDVPEIKRLAETVDTWWNEIEAFLRLGITNARTEGSNRTIKQLERVGSDQLRAPYPRIRDRSGGGVISHNKITAHPEPRRACIGGRWESSSTPPAAPKRVSATQSHRQQKAEQPARP